MRCPHQLSDYQGNRHWVVCRRKNIISYVALLCDSSSKSSRLTVVVVRLACHILSLQQVQHIQIAYRLLPDMRIQPKEISPFFLFSLFFFFWHWRKHWIEFFFSIWPLGSFFFSLKLFFIVFFFLFHFFFYFLCCF
jgi:hypothetical protein